MKPDTQLSPDAFRVRKMGEALKMTVNKSREDITTVTQSKVITRRRLEELEEELKEQLQILQSELIKIQRDQINYSV